MTEEINNDRRTFLGMAAMTLLAPQIGLSFTGSEQSESASESMTQNHLDKKATSGPLKQIDAGLLKLGYAEDGPATGTPVILLHGWPYDIYSFVDVAPLLAAKGYRVIVPYLRGYRTTRFLSADTVRNGQPSALATDVVELMEALKIEKAIVAGFDWGARTANIVAALLPKRVKAMVSVSGYLIGSQAAGKAPLPPQAELQ